MLNRINRTAPDGSNPLADSGCHPNQPLSHKRLFPYLRAPDIPTPLKNDHGEANYLSTVVFIFVAVLLFAFIIDLFGIISTKQQLDHCSDQMVKQIQLSAESTGKQTPSSSFSAHR